MRDDKFDPETFIEQEKDELWNIYESKLWGKEKEKEKNLEAKTPILENALSKRIEKGSRIVKKMTEKNVKFYGWIDFIHHNFIIIHERKPKVMVGRGKGFITVGGQGDQESSEKVRDSPMDGYQQTNVRHVRTVASFGQTMPIAVRVY